MKIKTLQALTAHDLRRYFVSLLRRELSSQYQNNLARESRPSELLRTG